MYIRDFVFIHNILSHSNFINLQTILKPNKMKTVLITSCILFVGSLVGCSVTESQAFKNDLCLFGFVCLFTLLYASHLYSIEKENGKK